MLMTKLIKVQSTVTHIIHNGSFPIHSVYDKCLIVSPAWKVDFNQNVTSFSDLLSGLRALVDLCVVSSLEPPPRLLFTSSIGVFSRMFFSPAYY